MGRSHSHPDKRREPPYIEHEQIKDIEQLGKKFLDDLTDANQLNALKGKRFDLHGVHGSDTIEKPVITSSFENVSDIGVCLG